MVLVPNILAIGSKSGNEPTIPDFTWRKPSKEGVVVGRRSALAVHMLFSLGGTHLTRSDSSECQLVFIRQEHFENEPRHFDKA